MKSNVREWLEQGVVDVFIAYIRRDGHVLPHVFTRQRLEGCDRLHTGVQRYPLEEMAMEMAAEEPELRIGLLARDCTTRSLNVLQTWNQLNQDRIRTLQVSCCPSGLREHARCSYLKPDEPGSVKASLGFDPNADPEEVETLTQDKQFAHWQYEFTKCIKCFGCRDICPVCFCRECSLENQDLIHTGEQLTEVPLFHLVRAVHMAGRCIDCGLCEEACPMDIPLRLLYRKVNEIVVQTFDYHTGIDQGTPPLNILGSEVNLQTAPL
jgi:ferredoxin